MALINTQELVERSFNQALTQVAVAEGYLADETLFLNNRPGYEAAMELINTTKGFCVEIYGAGSAQSKGVKRSPRIVINTEKFMAGDLGLDPGLVYEPNPNDPYLGSLVKKPLTTSDMVVDIHLVSSTVKQDRIIHAILMKALGQGRYLDLYSVPGERFYITQFGNYDVPELQEGQFERVYTYQAKDIIFDAPDVSPVSVVQINKITAKVYIAPSEIPKDNTTTGTVNAGGIINDNHTTNHN